MEALEAVARPQIPQSHVMTKEGEQKIEEIVENSEEFVESAVEDLSAESQEGLETLKQHAAEFVNQAKEFLDQTYNEAAERVHNLIESETDGETHSEEPKEQLRQPKNFKGPHQGRKGGVQMAQSERPAAVVHKLQNHGVKPHARMPCGGKANGFRGTKHHQDSGMVQSVKQFSNDLYQDVSSINFKQSFSNIASNEEAMSYILGGLTSGVFMLAILTFLAHIANRRNRAIQLSEEDDDESRVLSEKN